MEVEDRRLLARVQEGVGEAGVRGGPCGDGEAWVWLCWRPCLSCDILLSFCTLYRWGGGRNLSGLFLIAARDSVLSF